MIGVMSILKNSLNVCSLSPFQVVWQLLFIFFFSKIKVGKKLTKDTKFFLFLTLLLGNHEVIFGKWKLKIHKKCVNYFI